MKYQIGHVLLQRAKRRDHTYVLTRTDKHMNRRGRVVDILVWVGSCATCGCSFEATSPTAGGQYLNRNCIAHRRRVPRVAHQAQTNIERDRDSNGCVCLGIC
jgi:hypothetical protein